MRWAICCGEPEGTGDAGGGDDGEGAGDADGASEGWLCWARRAAAARRSALLRAAARRAARRAATARLCSRRSADWVLESRTCEGSVPPSSGPRPAPACWAELAPTAVSASAVDTPGAAGQSATTPEATAAVTTVEPVATIVIFDGLLRGDPGGRPPRPALCMGVLRRRCIRDNINPWSGARRALGFHPVALPRCRGDRGGQRRTDVTRVRATSCSGQPSRTPGAIGHPPCRTIARSDAGTC